MTWIVKTLRCFPSTRFIIFSSLLLQSWCITLTELPKGILHEELSQRNPERKHYSIWERAADQRDAVYYTDKCVLVQHASEYVIAMNNDTKQQREHKRVAIAIKCRGSKHKDWNEEKKRKKDKRWGRKVRGQGGDKKETKGQVERWKVERASEERERERES